VVEYVFLRFARLDIMVEEEEDKAADFAARIQRGAEAVESSPIELESLV
jgi:hypothetical protein